MKSRFRIMSILLLLSAIVTGLTVSTYIVYAAVKVTPSTATTVTEGTSANLAGPITIEEAAIADLNVGNITIAAPAGITFATSVTPDVVTAGDITLGALTVEQNTITIPVTDVSSVPSTIIIGGVTRPRINSTAAGFYNLSLSGAGIPDTNCAPINVTAPVSLSIGIVGQPPPDALPVAAAYEPYAVTLRAQGGRSPYTWTVESGRLPEGINLITSADTSSAFLTGQAEESGVFPFVIKLVDDDGRAIDIRYTLTVTEELLHLITETELPNAYKNVHYSTSILAQGGERPYSFSLEAGVLPAGLTIDSDGRIYGKPTADGSFSFIVQVVDAKFNTTQISASKRFYITVEDEVIKSPNITTSSLPAGENNTNYQATLSVIHGSAPYTWSLKSGTLPPGLNLNANGTIIGRPNATGQYAFVVTVSDSSGLTDKKELALRVTEEDLPLEIITDSRLPDAYKDTYFSINLVAQGGVSPYDWYLEAGNLPQGISLSKSGRLYGTSTELGSYAFLARVYDATHTKTGGSVSKRFILDVSEDKLLSPKIISNIIPKAELGVNYQTTLRATQGHGPYKWSLQAGSLPPGLVLDEEHGIISGLPTSAGTYTFAVKLIDSMEMTDVRTISVTVDSLFITTEDLPAASRAGLYRLPLQASGGEGSYRWTLQSGRLPSGMSVLSEGILAGTPMTTGTYNFTVNVRDGSGNSDTKALTLRVEDKGSLNIVTEELPAIAPGSFKKFSLEAAGAEPPYTWSLLQGELPRGLTLHANGTITGTTQAEGGHDFTIQVFDASGLYKQKEYSLKVGEPSPATSQPHPPVGGTISVYINNRPLQTDTAPFLQDGRTFVPLRAVFETLDARVNWDAALSQATITKGRTEIIMHAGKKEARVNGHPTAMDAAPILQNGRLMIPLRFVVETLGEQIHWDEQRMEVHIGG